MKILVVDDSKLARMAFAKALAALCPDCTLIEAVNADEALDRVRESSPDVAVVDLNMPGRDGLTLTAELCALKPGMPVAIVSANHQQEIVNRTHMLGAFFLSKPLAEPALREFLADAQSRLAGAGT